MTTVKFTSLINLVNGNQSYTCCGFIIFVDEYTIGNRVIVNTVYYLNKYIYFKIYNISESSIDLSSVIPMEARERSPQRSITPGSIPRRRGTRERDEAKRARDREREREPEQELVARPAPAGRLPHISSESASS